MFYWTEKDLRMCIYAVLDWDIYSLDCEVKCMLFINSVINKEDSIARERTCCSRNGEQYYFKICLSVSSFIRDWLGCYENRLVAHDQHYISISVVHCVFMADSYKEPPLSSASLTLVVFSRTLFFLSSFPFNIFKSPQDLESFLSSSCDTDLWSMHAIITM